MVNFYIFIFLILTYSTKVRIKFVDKHNMYLTLDKNTESFSVYSEERISQLPFLCYNPLIQNIDEDVVKIWFCGYKMCYDEDYTLGICHNEERRNTFRLENIENLGYLLKADDKCLGFGVNKVILDDCEDKINKLLLIENIEEKTEGIVSTNKIQIAQIEKKEENYFRQASKDSM